LGACERSDAAVWHYQAGSIQVSSGARATSSAASAPYARHAMAFVLCGNRGKGLMELTHWHAKPAVPFGSKSRIIDFALSNALNSGIHRIAVATQYKAHSLISHLQRGWNFFRPERNESFDILPASQRVSESMWYRGTADAVYQNIDIIESYAPELMVVLAGDHVYKMDYEKMLRQHVESGADVTVGCLRTSVEAARGYAVAVDENDRIRSFVKYPQTRSPTPTRPNAMLCSMGIYAFETRFLIDQLRRDAADPNSSHEFGKDVIPHLVAHGTAVAHYFSDSCVVSRDEADVYWRDVGTVDDYWAANIDLTDTVPHLDLFDRDWPIWTHGQITPPTKFVHDVDGRRGMAVSSLLGGGCIVSGASISRSLVSTGVRVNSYSRIHDAVILPDARIGRHARLSRVVVCGGTTIPEGLVVGEDPELDAKRFRRTANGVTLITQAMLDRLAS
jgi:glucose-1-phosphate adenylyltransferase